MPNANQVAENTLLASVILDNRLMIECLALKSDYFSLDFHQRLWSAMLELDAQGVQIDAVTLALKMGSHFDPAAVSDLLNGAVERPSVKQWAEIIADGA